jgi:prophage regulatory protein
MRRLTPMADPSSDKLVRLPQILGDPAHGTSPIVPVSRSTWWLGIQQGRFPKPIKLGKRCTVWRLSEVMALVNGDGIVDTGKDKKLKA